ncbi:MAG: hypothetical protein HY211_08470 [Candidatus Omnitrophica bacterium]|nr:hypothetical protein [Candidatus Omnitrophota bacterium]
MSDLGLDPYLAELLGIGPTVVLSPSGAFLGYIEEEPLPLDEEEERRSDQLNGPWLREAVVDIGSIHAVVSALTQGVLQLARERGILPKEEQ